MKLRINGKEIDAMKICGISSFLFDEAIKTCSYNINSNKHWIEFEILPKKPLERQKKNVITVALNDKIKELQEEKKIAYFFKTELF